MHIYLMILLGELIGLARATDGNEHLITPRSTALLRECLSSRPSDPDELQTLLDKITAQKREMVPDCFFCANPCGRTAPFNLSALQKESDAVLILKNQIIEALLNTSAGTGEAALYRGLIALGMENLSAEFLSSILLEIKSEQ